MKISFHLSNSENLFKIRGIFFKRFSVFFKMKKLYKNIGGRKVSSAVFLIMIILTLVIGHRSHLLA